MHNSAAALARSSVASYEWKKGNRVGKTGQAAARGEKMLEKLTQGRMLSGPAFDNA